MNKVKVNSQSLSECFYTIDTYGTFNPTEYVEPWYDESEMDGENFMKELLDLHVNVIHNAILHDKGGPILGIEGVKTSSPREYNFQTDQAEVELEVDLDKLLKWGHEHENLLDAFLHENFSDRPGFWSLTPNNTKDFFEAMAMESEEYRGEENRDKCIAILAGVYLTETETLTVDDYMEEMWDGFSEVAWRNFKQFTDETHAEYDVYSGELVRQGKRPLDIEEWYEKFKEGKDE